MTTPLEQAFELLLVGMLTVGIVLGLVVITGKLLIKIMNTLGTSASTPPPPSSPTLNSRNTIDPAIVAVLTATVEAATQGKGSIKRIDPI
jgi:hypothetical protein